MLTFWMLLLLLTVLAAAFFLTGRLPLGFDSAVRKESTPVPAAGEFQCRISARNQSSPAGRAQVIVVEVKGAIEAPCDDHDAKIQISIDDITEDSVSPVRCTTPRYCRGAGRTFFYEEYNGKIPRQRTRIDNWMAVASLPAAMLLFPRRGRRKLVFNVALVSCDSGTTIAGTSAAYVYSNESLGYLDAAANSSRTRQLGVTLAFAMSIADGKAAEQELAVIKAWAARRLACEKGGSPDAGRRLDKALAEAVKFFGSGGSVDIRAICNEIIEIAPESERFEIMRLCIAVARADLQVTEEEMDSLNRLGMYLLLDRTKLRRLFEQLIPTDMTSFKNIDIALGITSDMDGELIRRYLNEEYRRWNARVTNSDPVIRSRAERMMSMIAAARGKYIDGKPGIACSTAIPDLPDLADMPA